MSEKIKVHYRTRRDSESTAYIDDETGIGTDKHSDIAVIVAWDEEAGTWIQVDTWEWEWREYDDFYRVGDGKAGYDVEREALAAARLESNGDTNDHNG